MTLAMTQKTLFIVGEKNSACSVVKFPRWGKQSRYMLFHSGPLKTNKKVSGFSNSVYWKGWTHHHYNHCVLEGNHVIRAHMAETQTNHKPHFLLKYKLKWTFLIKIPFQPHIRLRRFRIWRIDFCLQQDPEKGNTDLSFHRRIHLKQSSVNSALCWWTGSRREKVNEF